VAVTDFQPQPAAHHRSIGPIGTIARLLVGLGLVGVVTWGHLARGFHPLVLGAGAAGLPGVAGCPPVAARPAYPDPAGGDRPGRPRAQLGGVPGLYLWEPTSDAALLFYGASMLLAALRGDGGCEVLAVPNWLLGRDDQIGCALFWPIDHREHH
jgi:hypothetical protein